MTRWIAAFAMMNLTLAGCGSNPGGTAANERSSPSNATNVAPPAMETEPVLNSSANEAAAVALPRAPSAPSALLNAAYQRIGNDWRPLLFLCDGVSGQPVKLITMPDVKGLSVLTTYRKPGFQAQDESVRLGGEDPGAGQIMRELSRADGTPVGNVHSINPGILGDEDIVSLPSLSSITDQAGSTRCRWMPRVRIMFVDSRRSVVIAVERDGYTYRSYDHAKPGKLIEQDGGATSVPTASVWGGRLIAAGPTHEIYEFRKDEWTYRIEASANNRAPGARLTVLRDGQPIQTSVATAYAMAAKRIE